MAGLLPAQAQASTRSAADQHLLKHLAVYLLHAATAPMQDRRLLATLSMAPAVVQEAYDDGDYIISQGVHGSDFFVIEHGEVTATLKGDASDTAMKEVSSLWGSLCSSATSMGVHAQLWRL